MKCKRTTDGRKHGRAALPVMRQQAIKAIREGQDVNTVAAAYELIGRDPNQPKPQPKPLGFFHGFCGRPQYSAGNPP